MESLQVAALDDSSVRMAIGTKNVQANFLTVQNRVLQFPWGTTIESFLFGCASKYRL
jgi:hypothetical protein